VLHLDLDLGGAGAEPQGARHGGGIRLQRELELEVLRAARGMGGHHRLGMLSLDEFELPGINLTLPDFGRVILQTFIWLKSLKDIL